MSEVEVRKEGFLPRITTEDIRELKQQYDMFRRLQKEVLEENIDYGYPAGRRSQEEKPSLYKSGAEKLTRLFNLTPRFELLKVVEQEDYVAYMFKCTLQTRDGFTVGEGYGSCNSREKRHWSENPLGNANTILKMAKKRSHVDAVLTGLGASNVFTQDLEDTVEEEQNNHATQNQLRYLEDLLEKLAKAKRTSKEHYIEYIKKAEKIEKLEDLTKEKASELIDRIQKALDEAEETKEEGEIIEEGEVVGDDVREIQNKFGGDE